MDRFPRTAARLSIRRHHRSGSHRTAEVHVYSDSPLIIAQAPELARLILEAADEIDRLG